MVFTKGKTDRKLSRQKSCHSIVFLARKLISLYWVCTEVYEKGVYQDKWALSTYSSILCLWASQERMLTYTSYENVKQKEVSKQVGQSPKTLNGSHTTLVYFLLIVVFIIIIFSPNYQILVCFACSKHLVVSKLNKRLTD